MLHRTGGEGWLDSEGLHIAALLIIHVMLERSAQHKGAPQSVSAQKCRSHRELSGRNGRSNRISTKHRVDMEGENAVENTLQTILVCVDGSEPSWQALSYAKDMCEGFPVRNLIAVHVIPSASALGGSYLPESGHMIPGNLLKFLDEQGEELARNTREELSDVDAEIEVCVRRGNPGMEILRSAEERDADMILIGNRGLSGFASILLGSVSERVARNAKCSVLIVRSRQQTDKAAEEA